MCISISESQSEAFVQTLAGFDFWNVEDYGRLGAVGDTSEHETENCWLTCTVLILTGTLLRIEGIGSWEVIGSQEHETRPTLLPQLFTPLQSKYSKIITFAKQTRCSTFSTFSTFSIFSTTKVRNQESNQIFQVFPSDFQSWEDCSLAF